MTTASATVGQEPRRRFPRALLIAAMVLVVIAPAAIVLLMRDRESSPPPVHVDRVDAGDLPTDITIAQGRAWIPSASDNQVYAFDDRTTPKKGTPYDAQRGALRVASDPMSVWVTGALGNSVTKLDALFGGEARSQSIPIGSDSVDVAVGREGVWVSNGAKGTVTRVDPVSNRVIGAPIRTGRFPTALAIGTHDVWVVNSGDGTLARIDPRENLVVGRRVNVGRDPQDVAVGFGSVWVANRGDGTLSRIDEETGKPLGEIRVGGAPNALAVSTEAILVLDSKAANVMRLDPHTRRVTNVVHVGGYPSGLAIGDSGALWTVDARSGTATRVSRSR